jgi:hypothetical protein
VAWIDSILVCSLHLLDSLQFAYYNFCRVHSSLRYASNRSWPC